MILSRGLLQATWLLDNSGQLEKSAFSQTKLLCRYAIRKQNGITLVYTEYNSTTNATITCKILKIGPVVSAENRLTDENCVACSRGSAYFIEYLQIIYWTDFRNLFTI